MLAVLSCFASKHGQGLHNLLYRPFRILAAAKETEVTFTNKPTWSINHHSHLCFLGSCFSETLSNILVRKKFKNVMVNHNHGITFNPISLADALRHATTPDIFNEKHIFNDHLDSSVFHSWLHHGSFSQLNRQLLVETIERTNQEAHHHLTNCNVLFVTFGTSFVHALASSSGDSTAIVNNCHKQPSALFHKRMLRVDEIVQHFKVAIDKVMSINPTLQIVITVSPVRHTREGLVENSRSKSILLLAAHELVDAYPTHISYFPSYEFFIDQLRDYRWYDGDDLIHPSKSAQELVFQAFANLYFSKRTHAVMKTIDAIQLDVNHRPTPSLRLSSSYQSHLERTLARIEKAQNDFSDDDIDFQNEIFQVRNQLKEFL